jgi:hypothetical protein
MSVLLAKTFSIESQELAHQLKQGYFLEHLLRPVFVWGVGIGTLLFLLAWLTRDGRLRIFSLILLLTSSLAVIPYLKLRKEAAEGAPTRAAPSAKVSRLRHETRWVFLTLAGLAAGTWLWGRRERIGPVLATATLIGGIGATGVGMWLEAYDAGAMHFTTPKPKEAETAGNYGTPN